MKATTERSCTVTLVLDEADALMLKSMMQNSFCPEPNTEPEDVQNFRARLFNTLNDALR